MYRSVSYRFFAKCKYIGSIHFTSAQSPTLVGGLISSDTVWTKENSPYQLIDNIVVEKGVTLTIEPGVTVSFTQTNATWSGTYSIEYHYTYGLEIDGTLKAIGTNFTAQFGRVQVYTGSFSGLFFSESSTNSTIQSTSFGDDFPITVNGSSPVFLDDTIQSIDEFDASPTIRDSTVQGRFLIEGGAPTFTGNLFTCIEAFSGVPVISNNTYIGNPYNENYYAIGLSSNLNESLTAIVSDNHIEGHFTDAAITISSGYSVFERKLHQWCFDRHQGLW